MNTFKVLVKIIFIAALAYLLQNVFAWWAIVLAAAMINFIIYSKGPSSFVSGFLGIGFLWFFTALLTDINTDSVLTQKVAEIFSLPSAILLVVVTAIIGGLAGGFGGLTGSQLRYWIMPPRWE
jgi:hypothetical protein